MPSSKPMHHKPFLLLFPTLPCQVHINTLCFSLSIRQVQTEVWYLHWKDWRPPRFKLSWVFYHHRSLAWGRGGSSGVKTQVGPGYRGPFEEKGWNWELKKTSLSGGKGWWQRVTFSIPFPSPHLCCHSHPRWWMMQKWWEWDERQFQSPACCGGKWMKKEEGFCGHHAMQPRQVVLKDIPSWETKVGNWLYFHLQHGCLVSNHPP